MTVKEKKRKGVADVVREQMGELGAVGFKQDSEFIPGGEFSPFGQRMSKGEIIRDRLIESCRAADGWYIKLDKDIGGNEWQFKDKILDFDNWTDLQYEISNYVREKTKLEIKRTGRAINYGSGRYRVIFFNVNGVRGEVEPLIFSVDAQEYLIEVPQGGVQGVPDVNEILKTVQQTSLAPSEIIRSQVEAMKQGMEIAKSGESKDNAMMTAMITMMGTVMAAVLGKPAPAPSGPDPMAMMNHIVGMAKEMGAFKSGEAAPKSLADTLAELKLLGIKVGENEDPMAALSKVRNIISLFREITGTGGGEGTVEPPSLVERTMDRLLTPEVVMKVLDKLPSGGQAPNINKKVVPQAQIPPRRQYEPPVVERAEEAPLPETQVEDLSSVEVPQEENPMSGEDKEMLLKVMSFAKELKEAVTNDRTDKFPYITEKISQFTDKSDFNIKVGVVTADKIISQIMMLDGSSYSDPAMKQKLVSYVNRYIEFVRSQGPYYAICQKCQDFAEYENKEQFTADVEKVCGQQMDGGKTCAGILQAMY